MTLGSDCSRPALPRWCWLRVCFLSSYKALRKHPEPVWNACSRSTRGSMRNMPFFLHTMITTPEKLNKQLLFPHMTHNQIGKPFVSGKLWPCAVRSDSGQGQTRKTDVAEDKSRELWQTEVAPWRGAIQETTGSPNAGSTVRHRHRKMKMRLTHCKTAVSFMIG